MNVVKENKGQRWENQEALYFREGGQGRPSAET